MSDDFSEIRPKSVPLSHSAPAESAAPSGAPLTRLLWTGVALLVLALAVAVFWVVPRWIEPPTVVLEPAPAAPDGAAPAGRPADDPLPPYQALVRSQARAEAQDQLAKFVELQLELEEKMQVGEWGQAEYDAAKDLAAAGDEFFLAENFGAAITSYGDARKALATLIERGETLMAEALREGARALDARDPEAATAAFTRALTIDPDDAAAAQGLTRAAKLPEVATLMRRAKNHELAGEFDAALAVYREVQALDPDTYGLDAEVRLAENGQRAERIREHLSDGFTALDAGRFEAARSAFQRALALDPGNTIAVGGLEQTADRQAGRRLDELEATARAAERREEWQAALDAYEQVLATDGNILFAREGRQRARAQLRSQRALANIIVAPEKLSSATLFEEAQAILARARALSPRGPRLAAQIDTVTSLIAAYRDPVPVTFVSDNATQVTVSTVGKLGRFDRKELQLRPGAYTVIGSRDGCRDVRADIVVRPNMQPVDIRCQESL